MRRTSPLLTPVAAVRIPLPSGRVVVVPQRVVAAFRRAVLGSPWGRRSARVGLPAGRLEQLLRRALLAARPLRRDPRWVATRVGDLLVMARLDPRGNTIVVRTLRLVARPSASLVRRVDREAEDRERSTSQMSWAKIEGLENNLLAAGWHQVLVDEGLRAGDLRRKKPDARERPDLQARGIGRLKGKSLKIEVDTNPAQSVAHMQKYEENARKLGLKARATFHLIDKKGRTLATRAYTPPTGGSGPGTWSGSGDFSGIPTAAQWRNLGRQRAAHQESRDARRRQAGGRPPRDSRAMRSASEARLRRSPPAPTPVRPRLPVPPRAPARQRPGPARAKARTAAPVPRRAATVRTPARARGSRR